MCAVNPWNSREELVHQVVLLAQRGTQRRAIARALGVSRNTVRAILKEHDVGKQKASLALPTKPSRAPRATKVAPFAGQVEELLARYPSISAQRVFEELRAAGYAGSHTTLKDYLRRVRPPKKPVPSLVTPVHGPGKMAESDWATYPIVFSNGQRLKIQVFGYILCHSRRKSFCVYERADLFALMAGHTASFERFGGVAEECKYDGQKAVVLGWEGKQPIFNPRFLAYATHYAFRPVACRPYHPNDKPAIERSFWYFERNFLNGRSFRDLEDLRRQLAHWLVTVADQHMHKKLKRPVLELFAEEAPHLLPLPKHPYDTARVVYRMCSVDGFISWDGNRYAVPYEAIYDLLAVRVTQREIFIYGADLRQLARHDLAPRSAGHDIGGAEVHPRREHRPVDVTALRASFSDLGEPAADFFTSLERQLGRYYSHHARQILLLRERFTSEDIAKALRHALAFGAFDHHAVARILQARAAPRTLAEYVTEQTVGRVEELLGRSETPPRDLHEYDRLPVVSVPLAKETPCPEPPENRLNPTPLLPPKPETSPNDSGSTSNSSD